jgi:K+-sensing histidine kinase KdpD
VTHRWLSSRWAGYSGAILGNAAITAILILLHQQTNSTTVALALLLVVLLVALFWGSRPALLASLLGMLAFNFFFLPPLYTFSIAHSENWVALIVFFTTALAVGQLSARAKQRAEEAETRQQEIERLYEQLRDAFERASQAEALKQSEKLKSALLDAVTHDLRTPLTSIKASITTLIDDARSKEQADESMALNRESRLEMLEIIDEECDRLNRFIGGLIDLARIEAGELQLRRRWGAVEEILGTALERAEPLTKDRHIELNIEEELPVVRVDERAVSEVLYTLIDNAVKYSSRGSTIRISAEPKRGELIQMTVEDEGPGIPAGLRQQVFDKFFRATQDGDITKRPSGSGMGLAIAKGIVEAHGGSIWIEAGSQGRGTKVLFTLPIGDDENVSVNVDKSVEINS